VPVPLLVSVRTAEAWGGGTTVLLPELTISPASVAFGNLDCAGGAAPQASAVLTLTNSGTGIMEISNYVLSGAQFASTLATPITLDPGASRQVSVGFSAVAASAGYTGTISVATNEESGSPHTVNLSATVRGVTTAWGVEGLNASNQVELGGVPTGYTIEKPFTVSNTGSTASSISFSLTATSSDCDGSFVICPPTGATTSCPTTTPLVALAGGESASYRLVFTAPATVPVSVDGGTGTKNCSAQVALSNSPVANLCNVLSPWTALAEAGQNAPLIVKPAAFYGPGQNIGVGSRTAMTLTAPCGSTPETQTLAIQNNGYNPVYFNCAPDSATGFTFGGVGCPGNGSSHCIGVEPGHEVHLDVSAAAAFAQNASSTLTNHMDIQFYSNDFCNAPFGNNTRIDLVATPLGDRLTFPSLAFGDTPINHTGANPPIDYIVTFNNLGYLYPSPPLVGTVDTTANVTFSITNDTNGMFEITSDTTVPVAANNHGHVTIRYNGPVNGVARGPDTATLHWTVAETSTCMGTSSAQTSGDVAISARVVGDYRVSLGDSRRTDFGNIFCGAQATPQTLSITNVGTGSVRITSYSNSNNTNYTITPPGSCTGLGSNCGCSGGRNPTPCFGISTCSSDTSTPGVCSGHCRTDTAQCNVSVTAASPAVFTITPARMDPAWITANNYSSYLAATSPTAFQDIVTVSGSVGGANPAQFTSQTFTEYAQGLYFASGTPVAPTAWNLGEVQWPGPPLASEMSATLSAAGNTPANLWLNLR